MRWRSSVGWVVGGIKLLHLHWRTALVITARISHARDPRGSRFSGSSYHGSRPRTNSDSSSNSRASSRPNRVAMLISDSALGVGVGLATRGDGSIANARSFCGAR